ncbi:MAG: 23S rRNA (pseudouridine(1915)-N(3))-methyltransferase RlmH [Pyramidobacter sp.]
MKLQVMALGRPRESFVARGVEHYQIRLKPLLPVEWVFLPDVNRGKNVDEERRKALEGREFLKRIAPQDVLYVLDERGSQMDSASLSEKIYARLGAGQGKLIFLVGGAYGTSPELQERADVLLSLSKMTFTHEMALLLLSEQLYRAAMIHTGSKYHH